MGITKKMLLLCMTITFLACGLLRAEDGDASMRDFKLTLGAIGYVAPEFEGSDKYKVGAFPSFDFSYRDRFFLSAVNGLGANIIHNEQWTIGASVKYRRGRDQDDSDLLQGMGDVKGGAEVGGFISYRPVKFLRFTLNGYHGLGNAKGMTADLGAAFLGRITEKLGFRIGVSSMFANNRYNRSYFGVDQRQSLLSGYEMYSPGSGIKHVAVNGGISYKATERIRLGALIEYKRLTGPAKDSPLVQRGSPNQVMGGLNVAFTF